MSRRLTPRPASQPFGELVIIGAASIAIGLVGCASSSNNRAPTCGPCCHGSHGPECQPVPTEPVQTVSDASVEDASNTESAADVAITDASGVATDPTVGQSSAAPPPPPPPHDAGVTRDGGTSGRRRGTTSNPTLGPDRSNAVGPPPTCGPRCHNPGGGDPDGL